MNTGTDDTPRGADPFGDEAARVLRAHWFRYLDSVEPVRPALHGYCRRLTGNLWDAEDLVQDTLLRGFGMAARGDWHGPDSPVRDARAYLVRTATNLWIDAVRRRRDTDPSLDPDQLPASGTEPGDHLAARGAVRVALDAATARESAALLLVEIFGYGAADVAEFTGTTEATVRSALARGRRKMQAVDADRPVRVASAHRSLVDALVEAINSGDAEQVIALMQEQVKIDVCNVGGGRGRRGVWIGKSMPGVRAEAHEAGGEAVVALFRTADDAFSDVLRIEGEGGRITRIVDHCYAPETLREFAAAIGVACDARAYHQDPDALPEMIRTTERPWRANGTA